jgi:hypothetical protein
LSLKERGDVALELDEFTSNGGGGARTDGATGDDASESSSAENGDVTVTHDETSSGLRVQRSILSLQLNGHSGRTGLRQKSGL